jgi:hypothetical protein
MRPECDRTRLIAELASLLRECDLPDDARTAGLTLIGFLARRMPGECASKVGVAEVRARFREAPSAGLRTGGEGRFTLASVSRRVVKKRVAL